MLSDLTIQNRYCLYKSNLTGQRVLVWTSHWPQFKSWSCWCCYTVGTEWVKKYWWDGTKPQQNPVRPVLPCSAPGRKHEGELEFCFFPLHIPCSWHWSTFLHMVFLCQHSSFPVYLSVQFFSVHFLGQILLYISSSKPAAGPHATCKCDSLWCNQARVAHLPSHLGTRYPISGRVMLSNT